LFCHWCCVDAPCIAQKIYRAEDIFAHNDYEQSKPFYNAYAEKVGYIEADIFLIRDSLMVSHSLKDIRSDRRIENMYLQQLDSCVKSNDGKMYALSDQMLTLSIDLKTDGIPTLNRLVQELEKYPALIKSKFFELLISGSMPHPATWGNYPDYIFFDGRPEMIYTDKDWDRIGIVSTSFRNYTQWIGDGSLAQEDDQKIRDLISMVHQHKKKLRFWATPDRPEVWQYLMDHQVDILGTDDVKKLNQFLLKSK
jgi:alkaline phosphatase